MTFLATAFFTREVERSAKLDTLERAELIAQKLETQFGALGDRARLFASSLDGGISFGGTGAKLSSLFFEQDPELLAVCIARRTDSGIRRRQVATNEERLAGDRSRSGGGQRSWLAAMRTAPRRGLRGATAVANVSPEFGSPVLALALPYVMRRSGEADSVVVAFATMEQVQATLSSRELYSNMLTGPSGDVIAHQDQALVLAGASLRDSAIVKDSLTTSRDPKQLGYVEGGKRYLGSYKKILSGALTVFSVVDEKAALQAVYQIQRRNIFIVLIVLAIALILALLFSFTLTTPIKRLLAATDRIREGDYGISIDVATRDELGLLTESFVHMGKGLAERERVKETFGKFVNKASRRAGAQGRAHARRRAQGGDHLLRRHPLLHRDLREALAGGRSSSS